MMTYKKPLQTTIFRACCLSIAATILLTFCYAPLNTYALTEEDHRLYNKNIFYYGINGCSPGDGDTTSSEDTTAPASASTGPSTLREKIAQLLFVGIADKNEAKAIVKKHKIGGVMLVNGGSSLFSKSAIEELQSESDVPLLIASDEEGGLVQRLKDKTGSYPNAKELGSQSNTEIEKIAKEYGQKLADLGITVNYAPVADIDDGHNSIISDTNRAFSSDPDKVAEKAGAFAKGMRAANVTPVFKHFPGHGRADGDSHTEKVTTPHLSSLKTKDLKPYETLLDDGTNGVMMGHLVVPGLTDGKQASISSKAIDLLRGGDYDFNGVIFSDEIANMKAIADQYSPAKAVSLAIQAGVDMPLFNASPRYSSLDEQVDKTIDEIERDVNAGQIDKSQIEASIRRISDLKEGSKTPAKDIPTDECACRVADDQDATLSGSNNIEKVYNYLVGKKLTPVQAAAITGNLMWESGGGGKDIPTNKTNPTSGAYGIVQWLGGRLTTLKERATVNGKLNTKKLNNLTFQLDYLWYELSDPNSAEKRAYNVLEEIKKMNKLEQVVIHWEEEFERSEDVVGSHGMNERIRYAKQVLKKSGGGSAAPTPSMSVEETCAELVKTQGSGESKGDFIWPVPKPIPITSCWGTFRPYYNGGRGGGHSGLDIGAPTGTPIKASDGGTVELAKNQGGGFGNVVVIKHKNNKWTLYAHMSQIQTTSGKNVSQGDVIGKSGNTGSSFGPHLHFNIQTKPGEVGTAEGGTLNPLDFLPNDGRPLNGCRAGKKG